MARIWGGGRNGGRSARVFGEVKTEALAALAELRRLHATVYEAFGTVNLLMNNAGTVAGAGPRRLPCS